MAREETVLYAPWAWGVGAIAFVWALVVFGAKTFLVPKNCYALKSSGEVTSPETFGPGLRSQEFGDEPIVIRINPITAKWSVAGVKLKDNFTVDLEGQATVSPDPRISGDNGINTYGAWILEGLSEGDDNRGVHNVEHGIQGGISSLVMTVLSETKSEDFDKSPLGFQLLLEAELACHEAPHHNTDFCDEVGGGPTNGIGSILGWYQEHHVAIREWLDKHAGHFAVAYDKPLKEEMISHHEVHVGSSHDHTIVTKRNYTPESLKLKQAEMSATEKGKGTVAESKAVAEAKRNATTAEANAITELAIANSKARKDLGKAAAEVARDLSAVALEHAQKAKDMGASPETAVMAGSAVIERASLTSTLLVSSGEGGSVAKTGAGLAVGMNAVNNPPATPPAGGTT
jgi:hypothetical protein